MKKRNSEEQIINSENSNYENLILGEVDTAILNGVVYDLVLLVQVSQRSKRK